MGMTAAVMQLYGIVSANPSPHNSHQWKLLVRAIEDSFKRWKKLPPGSSRAKLLHKALDKLIAADDKTRTLPISCRKGCSHCCYTSVFITEDEAELLADIVSSGYPIDRARLEEQAAPKDFREYIALPRATRKCVFLTDAGICGIYEDRPGSCRKYFVTSPPEQCIEEGEMASILVSTKVEAVLSGALNLGEPGPLPAMLLRKLK